MGTMSLMYTKTEYGYIDQYLNCETKEYHINYNIGNSKMADECFKTELEADDRYFELQKELYSLTDYLQEV